MFNLVFPIAQGTLLWQPILGAKSANRQHAFLLGTRILQRMAGTAERICAMHIHAEDVLGPSLGQV